MKKYFQNLQNKMSSVTVDLLSTSNFFSMNQHLASFAAKHNVSRQTILLLVLLAVLNNTLAANAMLPM